MTCTHIVPCHTIILFNTMQPSYYTPYNHATPCHVIVLFHATQLCYSIPCNQDISCHAIMLFYATLMLLQVTHAHAILMQCYPLFQAKHTNLCHA